MKTIDTIINQAEATCKAKGVRFTKKRKQLLICLLESEVPLSAYELVDACKEKYDEAIPAMSVYRILDFLEQENLVHKLKLSNNYIACDHIACDHSHAIPQFLICSECKSVKEVNIDPETIDKLSLNIKRAGFHLLVPQLEMDCICDSCYQNAQ